MNPELTDHPTNTMNFSVAELNGIGHSHIRDGWVHIYLFDDKRFVIIKAIVDHFYGRMSICGWNYKMTVTCDEMFESCDVDKYKVSKEVACSWYTRVVQFAREHKDFIDEIVDRDVDNVEFVTRDHNPPEKNADLSLSLDELIKILSTNVKFYVTD